MTEIEQAPSDLQEITALTAEIVGAYVGHHTVAARSARSDCYGRQGACWPRPSAGRARRGKADTRRTDQTLGDAGSHCLPRGRQEAEDAEAASQNPLRHDPR